jgi:superfamily I DNA/RNA helicase
MCVIAPNAKEAKRFTAALSKYNIKIITRNRVKGLTFDIVFIVGLENYFSFDPETNSSRLSQEKRIIYSSMGRARNSLYLLHQKKISPHFEVLRDYVDYFDYK